MAEHCANCGLVFSRHLQMRPDIATAQALVLARFHGFGTEEDNKGRFTYCPPVLSPGEASQRPPTALPEAPAVDHVEHILREAERDYITTRAQADTILNTCYPYFAVGPLDNEAAIRAATMIAKAVDTARGTA